MKNIIIAGPARAGKTTLAKRIHEEYGHFVLSLDKLMTVFGEAYPELSRKHRIRTTIFKGGFSLSLC